MIRRLYCGDNLEVLREQPSRSVHLVYLDPPFNSGRDWYMKPPAGGREQILAFTDKWKWTPAAAQQYKDCTSAGSPQGAALEWFRGILGESGPLAYLAHMAARFSELHRVLGPAGGLFLHVDETMSHYLKILLDQVFGCENFAGADHLETNQFAQQREAGPGPRARRDPRLPPRRPRHLVRPGRADDPRRARGRLARHPAPQRIDTGTAWLPDTKAAALAHPHHHPGRQRRRHTA